jgi:hypothetical protein
MTLTRLAQYTGETRVSTDMSTLYGSGYTPVSDQKYTGGYSYYQWYGASPFGHSVVPGVSSMRYGWWQRLGTTNVSNSFYLTIISNSSSLGVTDQHLMVVLNIGTSEMLLRRPNNANSWETLASATLPVQYTITNQWFHVGYCVKLHETDGFFSMYVDGERVMNYIGDTRLSKYSPPSNALYSDTAIYWFGQGAGGTSGIQGWEDVWIDDMYFDQLVDEPDNPVPARRFLMVLPTANGADTQWTPSTGTNWENIDDNPHDSGATYNKAVDPDLVDTFVTSDIVLPVDHRIVAAIVSPFARRLDSEIESELSVHAFDGTLYSHSPNISLPMSYNRPVFHRFETMPNGADWDEASFNAMQFGYASRGEL